METIVKSCLALAGLINAFPVIGALSAQRLAALYGIPIEGPDLLILMRHRAVLFGLLGGFIIYAAFRRELQGLAIAGGLASMLAFIGLAWQVGGYGPSIRGVVIADVAASLLLLAAAALRWRMG